MGVTEVRCISPLNKSNVSTHVSTTTRLTRVYLLGFAFITCRSVLFSPRRVSFRFVSSRRKRAETRSKQGLKQTRQIRNLPRKQYKTWLQSRSESFKCSLSCCLITGAAVVCSVARRTHSWRFNNDWPSSRISSTRTNHDLWFCISWNLTMRNPIWCLCGQHSAPFWKTGITKCDFNAN